ncbi:hypothetical protein ACU4GD_23105 [Cupriavidus basilensis]
MLFQETQYLRWIANTLLVGAMVVAITLLLAVPAELQPGPAGWQPRTAVGDRHLPDLPRSRPPSCSFLLRASSAHSGCRIRCGRWCWCTLSFTVPFCTWLMMGFFKSVPRDIEEAAMMTTG